MTERRRTINDEIQTLVDNSINQIPSIEAVTITKIYEDNNHADCKLVSEDILTYIPTISNNLEVGNVGLLIPMKNGSFYIITK